MHKFLTKVRVRNAEALLIRSDLPVGDIALDCGFATIQHFSRVFKEVCGQTPIEFRRRSLSVNPPGIAANARGK
jgi:AraC-like DNA-binding protein